MSGAWVDKADNPGMANWELHSADAYGAVVLVNFAAMAYRAAFTSDFQHLQPVQDASQLADLGWLAPSAAPSRMSRRPRTNNHTGWT